MKKSRKLAAFVASILAVACMAAPMAVSAQTVTITNASNNGAATHSYTYYKILTGTVNADTGAIEGIDWAEGFDSVNFLSAINTDLSINVTDAATFANEIKDESFDSVTMQKIAALIKKNIGTISGTALDGSINEDGYYLIEDTTSDLKDGAYSRYILTTIDADSDTPLDITVKANVPSVEKKVLEDDKEVTGKPTNDPNTEEKWNDVADYSIGEDVPFKLYGTMPSTIGDYTKYKYVFHDTLASQFDAPADSDVIVKIDGNDATGAVVTVNGQNITVTFDDILDGNNITADSIVTVEYSAVLNSNAVIGLDGQENEVYLTYSNNPNWTGTGDEKPDDNGETPHDKVIVFTYELDTTKIDGTTSKKLSGAKFKLLNSDKTKEATVTDGKFAGWVDIDAGTELVSDENGLFKVAGLDDDTYYLKETEAPSGYNLLTDSVEVVIKATTANNQEWAGAADAALTKLELNGTEQDADKHGVANLTVENKSGSSLPSTGGIGTTIFYVAGGALVVGAGVLLVSKKRMSNK